jgi:hypothetical protein
MPLPSLGDAVWSAVCLLTQDGVMIRHWGNKTPYEGTKVVKDP